MYPNTNRLPRNEFHHVFDTSTRLHSYDMTIIAARNAVETNRFGIIVGKTVHKHAVIRNRIKRLIRSSLSSLLPRLSPNNDIVFLVRKNMSEKKQTDVTRLIEQDLSKLHILSHEITHS